MKNSLPIITFITFAAWTGLVTQLVEAQEIDHAQRYQDCMAEVKNSPQQAFEIALAWRDLGGGDAADHCVAAALIGLGQHREAAGRLEQLAEKTQQKVEIKAGLLAHAAQAWMLAGNNQRAEAVLTAALGLAPGNPNLLIDRAQALAGQKNFDAAIEDLTSAIDRGGRQADAFVFRAAAYRLLDKLELALADIERALEMQPDHLDGLLERGILRRLRENESGARNDWLSVIRLAPESPAAVAARRNLEGMDVRPDK